MNEARGFRCAVVDCRSFRASARGSRRRTGFKSARRSRPLARNGWPWKYYGKMEEGEHWPRGPREGVTKPVCRRRDGSPISNRGGFTSYLLRTNMICTYQYGRSAGTGISRDGVWGNKAWMRGSGQEGSRCSWRYELPRLSAIRSMDYIHHTCTYIVQTL